MNYKTHKRKIRKSLLEQQPNCVYCNCKLSEDHNSLNYATLEHIVPQSKMGKHSVENLTLACPTCNSMRSSLDTFIGFQFKDSDSPSFKYKEDVNKVLQIINLQRNLKNYQKIISLVNNPEILLNYLNSNKTIKFINHILNKIIVTTINHRVLQKMVKFLNQLISTTQKQMGNLIQIFNIYNIELIEITVLEFGLIKQSY